MSNVDIEEIQFELDGLTLQGLACGNKNHELVLCLHGWLDNAASFVPLMAELPGKRIIAIDWAGHGQSSHRSDDAHYHFIDYIYDLLQLFERNKWQKVDIVAHSMGGMIASGFTAAFPEKVKTLTLIDSIGFISGDVEQSTEQLRQGMLSRLQINNKKVNTEVKYHQTPDSAISARMAVSDLNYDDAKQVVLRGLIKAGMGYSWRSDARLRSISPYRLTLGQAEQLIKDIKVPVQLIYGDVGMDMVNKGLKHFGSMFQSFQSYKLSGGHHIHMEQAQESAELIASFIAAHLQ